MIEYFKKKYNDTLLIEGETIKHYSGFSEEVNSVKYGVGIYNRSESAILKLSGKDVLNFLQRITTNDISAIDSYQYLTTLFTNEKGMMIDRASLIKIEDDYFLIGSRKNENILQRWIEKYIITEDVKIENYSNEYFILDIIGPQAESYLTLICGKDVVRLENNILDRINIEGINGFLFKKDSNSEKTYWLLCKTEDAISLVDYLLGHKSVFDLSMIGEDAYNVYRVINKIPAYPNEINDAFNPHEAGLINDVSFNKGRYIGQEMIAKFKNYDMVEKNLQKVIVKGKNKLQTPIELFDSQNNMAGVLTTLVKANQNNHQDGLGYILNTYNNKKEMNFRVGKNKKESVTLQIVN